MNVLSRLLQRDAQRRGVPGEHWASFGTGSRCWAGPAAAVRRCCARWSTAAGVLLLVRAATGRDGPLGPLLQRRATRR